MTVLQLVLVTVGMEAMTMITAFHTVKLVIMSRRIIILDRPLSTVITMTTMRMTLSLLITMSIFHTWMVIHSDLFESLFRKLPVDDNKYHPPGATPNGLSGPLLFPPRDHPSALLALIPHVDDGVFLPQDFHDSTFEQRAS
jgi:hypothetical protein